MTQAVLGLKKSGLALLLFAVFWGGSAQAALFGDDEARRAILDLRQRLEQAQTANRALMDQAAQQQTQQIAQLTQQHNQSLGQLRSALLDLQTQIDKLRADLAQSLGAQERLARDVTEVQLRQKDSLSSVDDRLRRFEPVKVSVDGREAMVEPAEKADFDRSMALFRQGDFPGAQAAFAGFLNRYPTSVYKPSVLFWLGNAQYANKAYREALANFQRLLTESPTHPRAAEAMLAISNVHVELKDLKAARKTLEDLVKAYPATETAATARERLSRLR
ncbi:tol-pal system protein YbgF [Limnohabitans sp.]|uniref:tol-pal system protein YbgF n=1 Tax=Limnohabitans sp. TaxID=1907725 RepID=UPI0033416182